jgi:endoglucanase
MKIKLLLTRALTKGICAFLLLMLFSFQSLGTSGLLPSGYLHTKGSQIVDQNNNPVRICSVGWGWYGGTPRGLNSFNYKSALQALVKNGINCVRICTDDAQVFNNSEVTINASANPDLKGLKYNQILQAVVNYGGSIGLKFIIESHLNENNSRYPSNGNGLWYDSGGASDDTDGNGQPGSITSEMFLQIWQIRAAMFKNNSAVIGYDIRNEPHFGPATWGDGNIKTDYRMMYEKIGNAILAIDPGPMIICEGLQAYHKGAPSGDLRQSTIGNSMISLTVPDKVVYSVHEYPSEVSETGLDSGGDYIKYMNNVWGWLYSKNIAPVFVGECGDNMCTKDGQDWANTFIPYLNGKYASEGGPAFSGNQQGVSWSWWDFERVQIKGVPNFGILNPDADGVDVQQLSFWSQLSGK